MEENKRSPEQEREYQQLNKHKTEGIIAEEKFEYAKEALLNFVIRVANNKHASDAELNALSGVAQAISEHFKPRPIRRYDAGYGYVDMDPS